jgi:rfaE bifunctional protein kinase chain/domain
MSQEEPTIVVTPIDKIKFIGGAGIVAAHASGLGSNATLISVVGDDELANFATNELQKYNVDVEFIIDGNRPTTLKQRFRSRGKSLLRINIMHQDLICVSLQEMIFNKVKSIIKDLDLVVFSDFNYGCLPKNLVDKITKLAKLNNVFISADSQSSSQIGDIGRFKEMDLITPTEHEARISMRNNTDGLVILAEKLRSHSRSKYILLKLGEEGVIIHSKDFNNIKTHGSSKATDSIPSLNTYPKDVAGAGDSMLITSSLALASGANIFESSLLGSISASIQIGRVGNTPLKSQEIISEIE